MYSAYLNYCLSCDNLTMISKSRIDDHAVIIILVNQGKKKRNIQQLSIFDNIKLNICLLS